MELLKYNKGQLQHSVFTYYCRSSYCCLYHTPKQARKTTSLAGSQKACERGSSHPCVGSTQNRNLPLTRHRSFQKISRLMFSSYSIHNSTTPYQRPTRAQYATFRRDRFDVRHLAVTDSSLRRLVVWTLRRFGMERCDL